MSDYLKSSRIKACPRWVRGLDALVALGFVVLLYRGVYGRTPGAQPSEFAGSVDMSPLDQLAVQHAGRIKSFDSHARSEMQFINGMNEIDGQGHSFTYLDLLFRPQTYQNRPTVYVKKKLIRKRVAQALDGSHALPPATRESFMETGLIAPAWLFLPAVETLLDEMERNVMRGQKEARAIRDARFLATQTGILGQKLKIIPPPVGDESAVWHSVDELGLAGMPRDNAHAGVAPRHGIPNLDSETEAKLSAAWNGLREGWQNEDASAVNAAIAELSTLVVAVNPEIYPDIERLRWESWYFRHKGLTWGWVFYLLAVVPLLMALIYRWRWAHIAGMVVFVLAFALHTSTLGLRWYISQRWPNSNMFEAVTTAAWFGGVGALLLELWVRRRPLRGLFALASAGASMTAMMCTYFLPVQLSSNVSNMMPILADVWLYIHTNVIIFSYCLIFMGGLTGLCYLRYRLGGGDPGVAKAGGAGTLIMDTGGAGGFLRSDKATVGQILDAGTMVLMELAFILLWTGLVMGAIWADHSWGRPWGWDPKEVFALCTFLIFLILVHVRFKVRDKGLWTAVLAVVGCAVMLFNWIVINFVISGLHSYA
ncbi:MAG: cytochrome c biogenesis protein CcsA [Planctomycetes bacterium]|nr:cytochrome c biogenesis protein CcsA [Planctomycetota bacterium]